MHIRIQQRNGKKSLTTIQAGPTPCSAAWHRAPPAPAGAEAGPAVQGLEKSFDYKKVLKAFKKGALPVLASLPCPAVLQAR